MGRKRYDDNGAELVEGSAAEQLHDEQKAKMYQLAAAPTQTGVNTYWGGTTSDQSRAADREEWNKKLDRIDLINARRDALSAQRSASELANPMSILSGQERRMQLYEDLKDKNKKSGLDTATTEEKLSQSKKISEFMTPEMMKAMYIKGEGGSAIASPAQTTNPSSTIEPSVIQSDPVRFKIGQTVETLPASTVAPFVKVTPMESIINTLDEFLNTESGRPKFNANSDFGTTTQKIPTSSNTAFPNRQSADRFVPWSIPETKPADPIVFGDDAFDKIIGPDGVPRFKSKRKSTVAFP